MQISCHMESQGDPQTTLLPIAPKASQRQQNPITPFSLVTDSHMTLTAELEWPWGWSLPLPSHAQLPRHAPSLDATWPLCKPSQTQTVNLTPRPKTRRQYGDDSHVTQKVNLTFLHPDHSNNMRLTIQTKVDGEDQPTPPTTPPSFQSPWHLG